MHPNTCFNYFLTATGSTALCLLLLLIGCSKADSKPDTAVKDEKSADSSATHGTNAEPGLTLDAETQKGAGVETTELSALELKPETAAYGRVLDASVLGTAVAELTAARITSEASQAELKRLDTLAGQTNVSDRVFQAGKAAAARDQAQADSAWLRFVSAWGAAIADRKDLPALIKSLASQTSALVQLSQTPGEPEQVASDRVRIATPGQTNTVEGEVLGPAPAVDPQLQGRALLVLVATNTIHLSPGMAVTGYTTQSGEPQKGIALPTSSVIRHNGSAWVYVLKNETIFERRPVSLERPIAQGWFVRSGVKAGEKVVTAGAQLLLSNELKEAGVTE